MDKAIRKIRKLVDEEDKASREMIEEEYLKRHPQIDSDHCGVCHSDNIMPYTLECCSVCGQKWKQPYAYFFRRLHDLPGPVYQHCGDHTTRFYKHFTCLDCGTDGKVEGDVTWWMRKDGTACLAMKSMKNQKN